MSTLYSEGTFASSDGKSHIVYFIWAPESIPVGIVQISHGMNEYIGRYKDFAEFLCSHGYVVCGNDHIGHGKSAANDNELGYIPRKGGGDMLVSDLHTMTQIIRQKFPKTPLFLIGHSMGSFIARLYLTKYANEIDGAIISGTGGPGQPTGMGKFVSRTVGLANNGRKRSKLIDKIAFGTYLNRIGKDSPHFAWLSRDENIVDKYSKDKYCSSFIFTADGFYTLFDMLSRVSSKKWAYTLPEQLPILLISGTADPVGSYGKGPKAVYNRLLSAGLSDLSIKLYPEFRHEVLNEIEHEKVYDDILEWLDKRNKAISVVSSGATV